MSSLNFFENDQVRIEYRALHFSVSNVAVRRIKTTATLLNLSVALSLS